MAVERAHIMIRAGILGPTGYSGLQLIRLLLGHPEAEIVYLGARREERPHIADIWPILRNRIDMRCAILDEDEAPEMDVAFVALPHTTAMAHVPGLLNRGVKVVDISADYRLKDPAAYKKWYKADHTDPDNLGRAVYGLCELFREDVAGADLVANPGCYPTAVELGLAPLLKSGLVDAERQIIVDAKSGVSGAGRSPKPNLHFPEANESVTAYRVGEHQHTGEMLQTLAALAGRPLGFLFVPHLMPMDRGILATCYVPLPDGGVETAGALQTMYDDFYAGEPFVRVRTDATIPTTKDVYDTNFCDIAVRLCGRTAVVVAVIDNLVKGASGQAVQNMNIMCSLDETAGLL